MTEQKQQISERAQARQDIAAIARQWVTEAPATFVADPELALLVAELQIRALLGRGWTPPAAGGATEGKTPAPGHQVHYRIEDHNTDPMCACGWAPPIPPEGITRPTAHAEVTMHVVRMTK